MNEPLASLLLDLTDLPDAEAEELTFREYSRLYLDHETRKGMVGELQTHDGGSVTFYEDRFDHAFFTTFDKVVRPHNKGLFDKTRAVRVRWIGEIIAGNIDGTECYHIPSDTHSRFRSAIMKRLYVLPEERYIVWLEPLKKGGWKFSTAYLTGNRDIRRITEGGLRKKISRD